MMVMLAMVVTMTPGQVYLAESLEEPGGLAAVKVIDKRELCREGDKMFLVDKVAIHTTIILFIIIITSAIPILTTMTATTSAMVVTVIGQTQEIEIMSQLDHAHIVRLYEVYENETEVGC